MSIDLIVKGEQLVVFPEGKINKHGKSLILKAGLYRLARLATKRTTPITIIPIGIAYSKVSPRLRDKVSLCFGEPLFIDEEHNLSIKDFNEILHNKMIKAEKIALKNVGR